MFLGVRVISVKVDTARFERRLQAIAAEQVPFATALALTNTARDCSKALTEELPKYLDNPTPFTLRAFAIQRAEKATLRARVFAKDAQGRYLKWQIDGGDRAPTRKLQRLPAEIALNGHGNLPAGEIKRLIALAKAGKRVSKARGARVGVSSKVDLFYGDPGGGRPVGIYKRIVKGDQEFLVPLVIMPQGPVKYRPRFPAEQVVRDTAGRVFPEHFRAAMRRAVSTAR